MSNYVAEQTLQSRVEALEKRIFQMEQARRLESSSIQNGSQAVYDDAGVLRARFGKQTDGSYGAWFFDPSTGDVKVRVGELIDGSFGIGTLDGLEQQITAAEVITAQNTTSTSFTDLTTVGPTASAYIGSARRCLVLFSASINANPDIGTIGVAVGGASSIAATNNHSAYLGSNANQTLGTPTGILVLTAADGLNEGTNTFTLKYRTALASSVQFGDRRIAVFPY